MVDITIVCSVSACLACVCMYQLHDCAIMIVNNLKFPRNFVGRRPVLGTERLQKGPGLTCPAYRYRAHSYFLTGVFLRLTRPINQVGPSRNGRRRRTCSHKIGGGGYIVCAGRSDQEDR